MCDPRAMCPEGARHGEPLREYAPLQRVMRRPQQKVGEICGLVQSSGACRFDHYFGAPRHRDLTLSLALLIGLDCKAATRAID